MKRNSLAVGVILLFFGVAVAPSVIADDTPPTTIIYLDPPVPNGDDGWYISNITITLNATDNESGVNVTYYRLNEGPWNVYTILFNISQDGEYLLECYSVDVAGNSEEIQKVSFKIDATPPELNILWDMGNKRFELRFNAYCDDITSGMNRVEFYFDDTLMHIDYERPYKWETPLPHKYWGIKGFIFLYRINKSSVTFFAFFVRVYPHQIIHGNIIGTAFDNAGNNASDRVPTSSGIPKSPYQYTFILQYLNVPNNFTGYINRFTIDAYFTDYPIQ